MSSARIQNPSPYGSTTEEKLDAFLNDHQLVFPSDYRQFLLDANGGTPIQTKVSIEERGKTLSTEVMYFYGLQEEVASSSLVHQLNQYLGRIPEGFLPIACDPRGSQFVMRIMEPHIGSIYYWDHEMEEDPPSFENMCLVSANFSSFFSALY